MAFKIFTKGSYFYIIDVTTGKEYEGLLNDVRIRRESITSEIFYFDNVNGWTIQKGINIADIQNENGDIYSINEFLNFRETIASSTDINIQDQHTEIINLKLSRTLDSLILLNNYNIYDRIIQVETTGIVPTIAMTVCLKEGESFYQGRPVLVTHIELNKYELLLDTPLDFAFTIDGGCGLSDTNLAVDGSVTPIIFNITPSGLNDGVEWDITSIKILFGGIGVTPQDPQPDDEDFGVQSAIQNGLILRSTNGIVKNIFNAKTNGDLRIRGNSLTYQPASKSGIYTVTSHCIFNGQENNGVVVRLKANTMDQFQLIVQDDLSSMSGGQSVVLGQRVVN